MKLRILIVILFHSAFLLCYSQHETVDSLVISAGVDSVATKPILDMPDSTAIIEYQSQLYRYGLLQDIFTRNTDSHRKDLHVPELYYIPGQASLFNWNNGEIIASGGSVYYPGLLKIDSGSLGLYQSFGNTTLYLGATVNKYGWFKGVNTQYGVNGRLCYQFSPRVSATLFGTYYFGGAPLMANGMPMPLSMAGYYGYNKFGGYVDCVINEHFGVQVGGQVVQHTYSNRYEAEPIATPYVKIGRKKKIGIGLPVGQILNHYLKR